MYKIIMVGFEPNSLIEVLFAHSDHAPAHLLDRLLSGDVGIIVLRGFLSPYTLSAGLREVNDPHALSKISNDPNTSLTTGRPYLVRHIDMPDTNFEAVDKTLETLPAGIIRIKNKICSAVSNALKLDSLDIAQRAGHSFYSLCVIRLLRDGDALTLHNDMVAPNAKNIDLITGSLQSQLSCIACLQECTSGGELLRYQKTRLPDHDHRNYKYGKKIIESAPFARFKPWAGDILIINTAYYHEISKVGGGTQITMELFFD